MGQIHADIELINGIDMGNAQRGDLDPDEIHKINVDALVDTGSLFMVINENIQEYLRLPVVDYRPMQLASEHMLKCPVVAPLVVRYKGETAHCSAVVMPDDAEPLLGAIPLEEMNIIIDPQRQELVPNPRHRLCVGLRPVGKLKL